MRWHRFAQLYPFWRFEVKDAVLAFGPLFLVLLAVCSDAWRSDVIRVGDVYCVWQHTTSFVSVFGLTLSSRRVVG